MPDPTRQRDLPGLPVDPSESHAAFYRSSPYAAFPQEHRRAAHSPVQLFTARQPGHDLSDPASPELVLVTMLAGDTVFRRHLGDGWSAETPRRPNWVAVTPIATGASYDIKGPHEMLAVVLPEAHVRHLLDAYGGVGPGVLDPLAARTMFPERDVACAMRRMWAEAGTADAAAGLLVDSLAGEVIARLLRAAAAAPAPACETRKLDGKALRRVLDLVDARCCEGLSVAEMAEAAHRSAFHFTRVFKATVGATPYRYVMQRRLARARALLDADDAPLAEIAYACGFSSQSHFTDAFTRELGLAPGRYRDARGRRSAPGGAGNPEHPERAQAPYEGVAGGGSDGDGRRR